MAERFCDFDGAPCFACGLICDADDVCFRDLDFFLGEELQDVFRNIALLFV